MEEISIVKKRSRLWPIVLAILLLVVIVLAVLWLMGNQTTPDVGWNQVIELGRRNINGIA
jgi:hypothetical protein